MTKDPWTHPDPQPGDLDAELALLEESARSPDRVAQAKALRDRAPAPGVGAGEDGERASSALSASRRPHRTRRAREVRPRSILVIHGSGVVEPSAAGADPGELGARAHAELAVDVSEVELDRLG